MSWWAIKCRKKCETALTESMCASQVLNGKVEAVEQSLIPKCLMCTSNIHQTQTSMHLIFGWGWTWLRCQLASFPESSPSRTKHPATGVLLPWINYQGIGTWEWFDDIWCNWLVIYLPKLDSRYLFDPSSPLWGLGSTLNHLSSTSTHGVAGPSSKCRVPGRGESTCQHKSPSFHQHSWSLRYLKCCCVWWHVL